MGVDVIAVKGAGVGLVLSGLLSLAYAVLLNRLAASRGADFFLPGFFVGVIGFLVVSVTLQYSRAATAGVQVGEGASAQTVIWMLAPAIAGAWFACRSVLRRIRRGTASSMLRPAGGFWGGVGLVAGVLLLGDAFRLLNR